METDSTSEASVSALEMFSETAAASSAPLALETDSVGVSAIGETPMVKACELDPLARVARTVMS
jgi:hypothetical protein